MEPGKVRGKTEMGGMNGNASLGIGELLDCVLVSHPSVLFRYLIGSQVRLPR